MCDVEIVRSTGERTGKGVKGRGGEGMARNRMGGDKCFLPTVEPR